MPNFRRNLSSAFLYFDKLLFGKTFMCKVERLNFKQRRSRWDGSMSRLIWIHAVCKILLIPPVAVKKFRFCGIANKGNIWVLVKNYLNTYTLSLHSLREDLDETVHSNNQFEEFCDIANKVNIWNLEGKFIWLRQPICATAFPTRLHVR